MPVTKAKLYKDIDNFRKTYDIDDTDLIAEPVNFVQSLGYQIFYKDFNTVGLRGLAAIPPGAEPGVIILNGKRSAREQGFVALHEMTHCIRHIKRHASVIRCQDDPRKSQNSYYEWEANEAAAELLMPYRIFIPDVVKAYQTYRVGDWRLRCSLQDKYHATDCAVMFRIQNLKYEIAYYCSTGQLPSDIILSRKAQESKGIYMDRYSISDLVDITKYSHV